MLASHSKHSKHSKHTAKVVAAGISNITACFALQRKHVLTVCFATHAKQAVEQAISIASSKHASTVSKASKVNTAHTVIYTSCEANDGI